MVTAAEFKTILVKISEGCVTVRFNRLPKRNSINGALIKEINTVLDYVENDAACGMVVLEGQQGVFCTGMDFEEVAAAASVNHEAGKRAAMQYMNLLKRFSLFPKVIIAKIDGQVVAGGVGIAAASDLVIATPGSHFSLSEALWGLLPAMVIPYLIRRTGYQKAYALTLTTMPLAARDALAIHLVDELSEEPDTSIRRLSQRFSRLEQSTVVNVKRYFRKMWLITDEMEETAATESFRLMSDATVVKNIENYAKYGKFPWNDRQ